MGIRFFGSLFIALRKILIKFLFHLGSFGEYISGGDVVEKISKSYYCDYCGERGTNTKLNLQEKKKNNIE